MKYYEVKMTCTEGFCLTHTVEAVNATIAVTKAVAYMHRAQTYPVVLSKATCKVVKSMPQWVG